MRQRVGRYIGSYGLLYWMSVMVIVVLSLVLLGSNNFSSMPVRRIMAQAVADADRLLINRSSSSESAGRWRSALWLTQELEIADAAGAMSAEESLIPWDESLREALDRELRANQDDVGYWREEYNGRNWTHVFVRLPGGLIFVESFEMFHWLLVTNLLIVTLSAIAVFCIWFVQERNGVSPFNRLSSLVLEKLGGPSEETEIAEKASFAIHITIVFVTLALFAFSLISGAALVERLAFAGFFALTVLALLWYRKAGRGRVRKYIYVSFFLLTPMIVHLVTGGFSSKNAGQVIVFSVMAVILSSFLVREKKRVGVFPLFTVMLFLDAIIEIYTVEPSATDSAMRFVNVVLFLGFAMFLSTDLYVTGITDVLTRLKSTQSVLVKKEKMVTLGLLIAGIAHEINTPLGAIKASVENLESSLKPAFTALMNAGIRLPEADKTLFYRLLDMANASMGDMYTTRQIRQAKPAIREFLAELNCESPETLTEALVRLDICNIDLIRENRDIFEAPGIRELLSLLSETAPLMRSTYIISQSTVKTSKIVFALKSYSHTTAVSEPVWLDLAQSIDNVLVLLYNHMKSGIELSRVYDEDLPKILGNPDELSQVWINLFQNAIQAMNGTGKLTVTIRKEPEAVLISVEDSGCGISPDVIDQIFEPFFTTKDVGEGTGLGLDICKNIITSHKGTISVRSMPQEGAAFDVRLPRYSE